MASREFTHSGQIPGLSPMANQGEHSNGEHHEEEEEDSDLNVGEIKHGDSSVNR